jgi:hypothetical protein
MLGDSHDQVLGADYRACVGSTEQVGGPNDLTVKTVWRDGEIDDQRELKTSKTETHQLVTAKSHPQSPLLFP